MSLTDERAKHSADCESDGDSVDTTERGSVIESVQIAQHDPSISPDLMALNLMLLLNGSYDALESYLDAMTQSSQDFVLSILWLC